MVGDMLCKSDKPSIINKLIMSTYIINPVRKGDVDCCIAQTAQPECTIMAVSEVLSSLNTGPCFSEGVASGGLQKNALTIFLVILATLTFKCKRIFMEWSLVSLQLLIIAVARGSDYICGFVKKAVPSFYPGPQYHRSPCTQAEWALSLCRNNLRCLLGGDKLVGMYKCTGSPPAQGVALLEADHSPPARPSAHTPTYMYLYCEHHLQSKRDQHGVAE